jgi:arginase
MSRWVVIEFPSNLGLHPSGVEQSPDVLREAGLHDRLGAQRTERVDVQAAYDATRPADTGVLNAAALRATSFALAERVAATVCAGDIPIVLAGDCSVILGGLLGLRLARRAQRQSERIGLLFVDGHVDFYQPDASPTGEAADMDLALATGRGPALLTQFDGAGPLVHEEDVVAVGARDAAERARARSQDIRETSVSLFELDAIRDRGIETVAGEAMKVLRRPQLAGFWLHLDADVLDDAVMPAVDYRQPGGLSPAELSTILRQASATHGLAGASLAIYNPSLDPDRRAARALVSCVTEGFELRV